MDTFHAVLPLTILGWFFLFPNLYQLELNFNILITLFQCSTCSTMLLHASSKYSIWWSVTRQIVVLPWVFRNFLELIYFPRKPIDDFVWTKRGWDLHFKATDGASTGFFRPRKVTWAVIDYWNIDLFHATDLYLYPLKT